jgi:hypothetical protein
MLPCTSLLKSHSTFIDSFISALILSKSSSDKVSIFTNGLTFVFSHNFNAVDLPIP